jgi:hypothetical protein
MSLSETLEEISIELPEGEQERRIIGDFIAKGEDISLIKEVCSDSTLGLDLDIVNKTLHNHAFLQKQEGFLYVPSINLYVAKERTLSHKNWFECHTLL